MGLRHGFLVATALRAGILAWARRIGLMTLAFAAVALANLPVQGSQAWALDRLGAVSRRAEERGDRIPEQSEAIDDLRNLSGACFGLCGGAAFGILVLMPVVSGASVLGARAVRGNARPSDLLSGFRRYGATLAATLVTGLAGGGIAVAVATVDTLRILGAASDAVGALVTPGVAWAIGAAITAVTLWLCARLWFASVRVADPERPRLGGMAAVSASWHWTAGPAQWHVLALMAIGTGAAALAMALAQWSGRMEVAVAGAWVTVTLLLAVFGAAYEVLADASEPILPPPPAPPAFDPPSGALDA